MNGRVLLLENTDRAMDLDMLICTFSSCSVPLICYSHRVYSLQNLLSTAGASISYIKLLLFRPALLHSFASDADVTHLRVLLADGRRTRHCEPPLHSARPAMAYIIFSRILIFLSPLARAQVPSRSQHTAVRLPLLQVLLSINRRARLVVVPGLGDLVDALRDERRQLKKSE
jgi:hypothetical protein